MKKPARLYKKRIKVTKVENGFTVVIQAAGSFLYTFTKHSPYWYAKRKTEEMIKEKDMLDKSKWRMIPIGYCMWVDSETRERI